MGLVDELVNRSVYLDANVFIYALESFEVHAASVQMLFAAIDNGRIAAITSELTRAELLVKPFRLQNLDLQRVYLEAIQDRNGLRVVPVSREVLLESARLRAVESMRLPDGIHFATARLTGCGTFVSNDLRLRSRSGIDVVRLPETQG